MKFTELNLEELSAKASEIVVKSFLTQHTTHKKRSTFPVLVGAGISYSAGVPLSVDLINELAKNTPGITIPSEVKSYEDILKSLRDDVANNIEGEDRQYLAKKKFAPLLNNCGIPKIENKPLPNLANLILYDLAMSQLIGPVISLNVDVLLECSEGLVANDTSQAKFIHNISQFSCAEESVATQPANITIFQPHGTIEEPFSLRFSRDELLSKSVGITSTITNLIGKTVGMVVIGANLRTDDVVVEILSAIAVQNSTSKLEIVLPLFGKTLDSTTRELLQRKLNNNIGSGENIEIFFATNVAADDFFAIFRKEILKKHQERKASGMSGAFLPSFAETEFRHYVYRHAIQENVWPLFPAMKILPPIDAQIRTEVFIFCIAARGPFTTGALVEWLQAKRYLTASFFGETAKDVATHVRYSLDFLLKNNVISYVQEKQEVSFAQSTTSFDSVRSRLFFRGEMFSSENSKEKLASVLLKMLSVDVSDVDAVINNLAGLISNLEMDREGVFEPFKAFSLAVGFRGAAVLDSHKQLESEMDKAKNDFCKWVKDKNDVTCKIMTETGDHLFLDGKLERFYDSPESLTKDSVRESLRPWLHPIFDAPKQQLATLKVMIADHEESWAMKTGERVKFDRVLLAALVILSKQPKIMVMSTPWDKHDDHMLLVTGKLGTKPVANAIAFPRIHGESNFFAFQTKDLNACKEIEMLFDKNMLRYAAPIESTRSLKPVLAVTIVDASSPDYRGVTDETELLIGVREPNSNSQHANVASVPTRFITEGLLWDIVNPTSFSVVNGSEEAILQRPFEDSGNGQSRNPAVLAVDYLLARKLGLAEALEAGDCQFRVTPVVLKAGPSPLISDDDRDEWLLMVNILVELRSGRGLIPKNTTAYSKLEWIKVKDFLDATSKISETNETASLTISDGTNVSYICGGLCVCTASVLIEALKKNTIH